MKTDYRVLFNDDGFCTYSNASRYQSIDEPVGLAQVHGYVDEVADANIDCFMLCPNMYQLPGWDTDLYPFWRNEGRDKVFPDTAVGRVMTRCRDFIVAGNDLIQLSLDRAHERGIDFFITWRMLEAHGVTNPKMCGHSDFWHAHPEYRNNPEGKSQWDQALSFKYEPVRERKLAFLEDLIDRYAIDGLELDCMRFPFFFPREMPFEEKAPILTEFIRRVRGLLEAAGRDVPIVVRVPSRPDLAHLFGMDVGAWVEEGLVQLVNVAGSFIQIPDIDIEGYCEWVPQARVYGEMTHCMQIGRHLELSAETSRKVTREAYWATALSYLDRGAAGVSFFNFTYTRDYSFGDPRKLDRFEPDYDSLKHITDQGWLVQQEKHYYLTVNRGHGVALSEQLPVRLEQGAACSVRLHVGDERPGAVFRRAILRLMCEDQVIESREIGAQLNGVDLKATVVSGELFDQPYRECIPETHAPYRDFEVPLDAVAHGWNEVTMVLSDDESPIEIRRVELALYL